MIKSTCNIPQSILEKRDTNLHNKSNHPIGIIKEKIYNFFGSHYEKFDTLSPVVSVQNNFDDLLIPPDHPCRRPTDTYYLDEKTLLRTQTSAHQTELMRKGFRQFLVTGDVYRKDEIDKNHYPVFHQMEGVKIGGTKEDLIQTMTKLMEYLFPNCECRVNKDYFPFTDPSFEIEVMYNGKWLEVAGMGCIRKEILEACKIQDIGWAFGLGLERLAMVLFKIPDIRLFWSNEPKFLNQFQANQITIFKSFSSLDELQKDISFFIPDINNRETFQWNGVNDFYDICRDVAGDMLEKIERLDAFFHPKMQKVSHTYRLTYSPCCELTDPGKFTEVVNQLHGQIYQHVKSHLNVIMR